MDRKVAILKIDKITNKKETFYIVYESIFDIRRKNNSNLYAFKKLMELERLAKGDEAIAYEFKLIGEADLEVYLSNCLLNDKQSAPQGSFFAFLAYYARTLDEFINNDHSKITVNNSSIHFIIDWAHKNIKEQQDPQISIKQLNRGK